MRPAVTTAPTPASSCAPGSCSPPPWESPWSSRSQRRSGGQEPAFGLASSGDGDAQEEADWSPPENVYTPSTRTSTPSAFTFSGQLTPSSRQPSLSPQSLYGSAQQGVKQDDADGFVLSKRPCEFTMLTPRDSNVSRRAELMRRGEESWQSDGASPLPDGLADLLGCLPAALAEQYWGRLCQARLATQLADRRTQELKALEVSVLAAPLSPVRPREVQREWHPRAAALGFAVLLFVVAIGAWAGGAGPFAPHCTPAPPSPMPPLRRAASRPCPGGGACHEALAKAREEVEELEEAVRIVRVAFWQRESGIEDWLMAWRGHGPNPQYEWVSWRGGLTRCLDRTMLELQRAVAVSGGRNNTLSGELLDHGPGAALARRPGRRRPERTGTVAALDGATASTRQLSF